MEDITKFRLKSEDELAALFDGRDNLFVIACNKCFKEFTFDDEPELQEFTRLALKHGKTVAGSVSAYFLCNKHHTEKLLGRANVIAGTSPSGDVLTRNPPNPQGIPRQARNDGEVQPKTPNIFVIACGFGVQTVADLSSLPVFAASDSVGSARANHGLALTKLRCEACGQCYLNNTGGICPIVDCSKSLVNGQCGGAKDGMCEVDKDKDCAWERIYENLSETGRASVLRDAPVMLRDYSKLSFKLINDYVKSIREKRLEGYYGGLHPHENKELCEHIPLARFPGLEADEQPEPVCPHENPDGLSADEIISIIKEMGIVGMGGAGFPTHIKLKSPKPIDTVLLNGCECEPYLTADHRVMLEFSDDVIAGLKLLLKATGAERGIIAIEDNKPDAIKLLHEKTADIPGIDVISVKTKYPQGAEKMLIKRALGRSVPSGGLPFDVGVIVSNVSTAKAVSDAVIKGMPLTERVVTVSGEKIKKPGNYIVKIGTTVKEIIDYCGGLTDPDARVLLGGPMMGHLLSGNPITGGQLPDKPVTVDTALNVPITKTTNGIIAIAPVTSSASACIRCGRCVDVCPMELFPLLYPGLADKQNWEGMKEKAVNDCIECGCCDFICPSKIPIREAIRKGKLEVKR